MSHKEMSIGLTGTDVDGSISRSPGPPYRGSRMVYRGGMRNTNTERDSSILYQPVPSTEENAQCTGWNASCCSAPCATGPVAARETGRAGRGRAKGWADHRQRVFMCLWTDSGCFWNRPTSISADRDVSGTSCRGLQAAGLAEGLAGPFW